MKNALYPRLAVEGIRKNRQLYLPYLLSCAGTVMMAFILMSLSNSPVLQGIHGGRTMTGILSLGQFVIAFFAVLFLFYTNSFLIRRRCREFGLYSVLGMSRAGIGRIILWESLISSFLSLALGLLLGLLLSKLAELGLINMVGEEINYSFQVSGRCILICSVLFGILFVLLALRSLIQVRRSNPLALLRSESVGEKPPKANWIPAAAGILLLGGAYWISLSIGNPIQALMYFFTAVLMVIAATYLLFMSGSVAVCRLLQKNRRFYYKKQHFVSVSNMVYRMKRNGAGLASICILATMVLVMISSTSSLYFGSEDALKARYSRDTELVVTLSGTDAARDGSGTARLRNELEAVYPEYDFEPRNVLSYTYAETVGALDSTRLNPDSTGAVLKDISRLCSVEFITAEEINRELGTDYHPKAGEACLYTLRCDYPADSFSVGNLTLKITERLDRFLPIPETNVNLVPVLMLVIRDWDELRPLDTRAGDSRTLTEFRYCYAYDSGAPEEVTTALFDRQLSVLQNSRKYLSGNGSFGITAGCVVAERSEFLALYGGLFFLGIVLSLLFIFAAAVIIYYKQISEGYEDQKRFAVMRKVGMTKRDIRKTVNSQILTVFFAPLLFAALHLAFAFPVIWKLLTLFNMTNLRFVLMITAAAFTLFAVFYALIYKLTARRYFTLVSSAET